MDKVQAILKLYPNAAPLQDFRVADDLDGKGPYIAQWNVRDASGNPAPQPTDADLQTAWNSLGISDLSLLQAAKKAEISAAIGAKIVAGYQSTVVLASTGTAHLYGTDMQDQSNMNATYAYARAHPTETVKYRPQDVLARVVHTNAEFVQVAEAVFNRINAYLDQGYALREQVDNLVTVADVNAFTYTITDPS